MEAKEEEWKKDFVLPNLRFRRTILPACFFCGWLGEIDSSRFGSMQGWASRVVLKQASWSRKTNVENEDSRQSRVPILLEEYPPATDASQLLGIFVLSIGSKTKFSYVYDIVYQRCESCDYNDSIDRGTDAHADADLMLICDDTTRCMKTVKLAGHYLVGYLNWNNRVNHFFFRAGARDQQLELATVFGLG